MHVLSREYVKAPFGNGWFQNVIEVDFYIWGETMLLENISIGNAAKTHLDCFHDS